MSSRSLVQRTCVILGLIALATYLFYVGKGHTLLLDTNAITVDGKELRSWSSAAVSVDGVELNSSMGRAERVMLVVGGPKHTIVITDDSDPDKKVERTFRIPTFLDMAIVSIPAILGDAPMEHWVVPFTPPPVEDAPVEKMHYQKD